MMVPRSCSGSWAGFDEALVVEFNDTDLCLRALDHGARVVWTPRAVLTHYEQLTRGGALCLPDHVTFAERWGGRFSRGDPFYHPALSETRDYVLATPAGSSPRPANAGLSLTCEGGQRGVDLRHRQDGHQLAERDARRGPQL